MAFSARAPVRRLGLTSAIGIVVASMVGSGVFTTSGFLLSELHSPGRVLAVWLVGGLLAILGALCYGALARQYPESGGEYLFLARTLHPSAGHLAGWVSLLVGFSAPLAAVALAFGQYIQSWLPAGAEAKLTGSGLLIAFTLLHALHVQRGAWVQNAAVLIKLLLIAVLLAWAAPHLRLPAATPVQSASVGRFALGLVMVSFSYSGWNAAVYIGAEIRAPERNLPRAMLWGAGLVVLLYLALNAVFVFAAPVEQLQGQLEIGRVAALALGGKTLADFTTLLIALALATSLSSMMMAGPRVYARMADDGCLPRWFCFPAQGPPSRAILLQAVLALLMLWTASFEGLLTYIGFTLSLSTAATVAGLFRLRLQKGSQVQIPGWPWVPVIFFLTTSTASLLSIAQKPIESALGLATLLAGWTAWSLTLGKR